MPPGFACRIVARAAVAAAAAAASLPVLAQPMQVASSLADLSLEQLAQHRGARRCRAARSRSRAAPASIYVITGEDIRRSGATSLPEALRLAPNLQVARADANQYAISARGFNNVLANKLLVLIDGRTVYTPLFSGVFWEAQDVMLEDVERIEVISGPGATLWGANAVNGVINIITRTRRPTRRARWPSVGAGNREASAAARYGGDTGRGGHYRIYAKYVRPRQQPTRRRRADPRLGASRTRPDSAPTGAGRRRHASRCRAMPTAASIDQAPVGARPRPAPTCSRAGPARSAPTARARACRRTTTTPTATIPSTFKEHLDTFDVEVPARLPAGRRATSLVGRRAPLRRATASRTSPRSPSSRPTAR